MRGSNSDGGESMSGLSVLLVLASAGLHAGWNRLLHDGTDRDALAAISYLSVGVLLLPALIVAPPSEAIAWLLASSVCHSFYLWLLSGSFERGGLSVTYPIARGTSPLLVVLGGWIFLDQRPSVSTAAGMAVLTAGLMGLVLIGRHLSQISGVSFAIATGLSITSYTILDARAVADTNPTGYLSALVLIAGALTAARVGLTRDRVRAAARRGFTIGVGQGSSYLLVLYAMQRAQAGQVASLRQVSVVIGVLLGGAVLRRPALGAAALVAVGAILVTI